MAFCHPTRERNSASALLTNETHKTIAQPHSDKFLLEV